MSTAINDWVGRGAAGGGTTGKRGKRDPGAGWCQGGGAGSRRAGGPRAGRDLVITNKI
jgi:hypothetical protein